MSNETITKEDVQASYDMVLAEVIAEYGASNDNIARAENRLYNTTLIDAKVVMINGKATVISFKLPANALARVSAMKAEREIDRLMSGMPVDELKRHATLAGDDDETKAKRRIATTKLLLLNANKVAAWKRDMLIATDDVLKRHAEATGDDEETVVKRKAAIEMLQEKEFTRFSNGIVTASDADLAMLKGSILENDPIAERKRRAIANRESALEKERVVAAKIASTMDVMRTGDARMAELRALHGAVTSDTERERLVNRLQWQIDAAKGDLARRYLDEGETPAGATESVERIARMEEDLRLVKVIFYGVESGIGYNFGSYYETYEMQNLCREFPTVNDHVFTVGDDCISVIVTDHGLTRYEKILVARDIIIKEDDEGGGYGLDSINDVLEMLESDMELPESENTIANDGNDEDEDEDDDDGDGTE